MALPKTRKRKAEKQKEFAKKLTIFYHFSKNVPVMITKMWKLGQKSENKTKIKIYRKRLPQVPECLV